MILLCANWPAKSIDGTGGWRGRLWLTATAGWGRIFAHPSHLAVSVSCTVTLGHESNWVLARLSAHSLFSAAHLLASRLHSACYSPISTTPLPHSSALPTVQATHTDLGYGRGLLEDGCSTPSTCAAGACAPRWCPNNSGCCWRMFPVEVRGCWCTHGSEQALPPAWRFGECKC